jgi:uncharacterized membrane protein
VIDQLDNTALSPQAVPPVQHALARLRRGRRSDVDQAAAALRFVYAGVLAYATLFVFAAVLHYVLFRTAHADLGSMVQAVWNTLHGHFLETTTATGQQVDRLGFHVDPFLVLLAPLLWISSSPVVLPIVQALAVASGAFPVFWLARKHLGSTRAGANFAFAYLLFPATQFNAFTIAAGFHAVSIAVPLLLYAVWFLDEDRVVAFSIVALLAFTTNEVIPLAVGCLGIWYAVRRGRRVFGLSVFFAGLAVTVFDFLWVIPHFSPSGVNPFANRYHSVGGTPGGMAHKLVTDPLTFVHAVASGHKAAFVALLLVPFLGLWLLEPLLFLGALPSLAINLLSSWGNQTSIGYEDTAAIVPFVVAASIFGASRLRGREARISLGVLVAVGCIAIYSPIFFLGRDVRALGSPLVRAEAHAVSLIPQGGLVSASNQIGGHLSERRYISTFPYVARARWIVVDLNDPTYGSAASLLERELQRYKSERAWRVVFSSQDIVVLHKPLHGSRAR